MFTIVFKPTVACNLRCDYCYLHLRDYQNRQNQEIAKATFSKILSIISNWENKRFNFIFHGGEPLLLGVKFWEDIFSKLDNESAKNGYTATNSIQTNLLLLTQDFIDLFKTYDVRVSTSIDGTKEAHDYYRKTISKKTTWNPIIDKIQLCKDNHMPLNAVCVINNINIDSSEMIYNFFRKNKISVRINHITLENEKQKIEWAIKPGQYGKLMTEITDLWFNDENSPIDIQPISEMYAAMKTDVVESCIFSNECQNYFVAIGPNGNVWPCGKAVGIEELIAGNIFDTPELLSGKLRNEIYFRKSVVPEKCSDCQYRDFCRGICPLDNIFSGIPVDEPSPWCKDFYEIWNHLDSNYS